MRNPVLVLFLAACLAVPATAAAWGAKGDTEPNTALDAKDGYMFTTSNQAAVNKVYFNGFGGMCMGAWAVCLSTSFNPNVGSLGTGVPVYPYQAYAMLGVWRDCNKDNYIGMGEQGLLEYRLTGNAAVDAAVFKVDTSICPKESIPTAPCEVGFGTCIPSNAAPVHNDGTWVREFLPIGWGPVWAAPWRCPVTNPSACLDPDPYDYNDNGARVWADWGYPGDPPGNQCYARPHPRGTWHSVGGAQTWADCYLQNRIIDTVNELGLGPTYSGVKGSNCDQSSAVSYRPGCNPWGEESQKSYVDAFDCSGDGSDRTPLPPRSPTPLPSLNPVGYLPPPKGAGTSVNPDGSMAGTMNETNGDFFANCRQNRENPLVEPWAGPYSTETDITNLNGPRNQHDMEMFYSRGTRPTSPWQATTRLGSQTSEDAGAGTFRQANLWVGNSVTAASRNPYVDRASLNGAPSDVWSMTFYAYVSSQTTPYGLVLPTSLGTYGSEACGTAIGPGAIEQNRWLCDDTLWWPDNDPNCDPNVAGCSRITLGGQAVEPYVDPGQPYQLRDIDCWDYSTRDLRAEGIHYGVLSGTACV